MNMLTTSMEPRYKTFVEHKSSWTSLECGDAAVTGTAPVFVLPVSHGTSQAMCPIPVPLHLLQPHGLPGFEMESSAQNEWYSSLGDLLDDQEPLPEAVMSHLDLEPGQAEEQVTFPDGEKKTFPFRVIKGKDSVCVQCGISPR